MITAVASFTTKPRPVIVFDVDGEEFKARGVAPVGLLLDVNTTTTARVPAMLAFVEKVLEPDSATRFTARLRDPEHPIDGETFGAVLTFLLESYGRNGDGDG